MQIQDFVPSGNWVIDCYHTLTSNDQVRIDNNGTIKFYINDTLIVITRRPITYLSSFALNPHIRYWKRGGDIHLAWNNPGEPIETEIGTIKTLICVPNTNDSQVDKKFKYAKAILSLKYGLTLTWAKLTQYIVDSKGGHPNSETPIYSEPY